ncbi:unnamed protein product [Echinostoma caproni]|uniref:26S proteasome complex subunit SEM1 n=1 Tax=Echinostoma caproni TaxID=27848 RepID=A0A183A162_9TREM|nr:unnamed protein product [Echinostoma caproni]
MAKVTHIKSDKKPETDKTGKADANVELGMLEEDDEFEEFVAHGLTGDVKSEEITVWEDNWDDDVVDDEFTHQLRTEFQKQHKTFVVPEIFPNMD